jgi:hypothetical protein
MAEPGPGGCLPKLLLESHPTPGGDSSSQVVGARQLGRGDLLSSRLAGRSYFRPEHASYGRGWKRGTWSQTTTFRRALCRVLEGDPESCTASSIEEIGGRRRRAQGRGLGAVQARLSQGMDMEVDWIGGGQNSSFGKGKKNKRNGTMTIVCIMRFGGRAKQSKKKR